MNPEGRCLRMVDMLRDCLLFVVGLGFLFLAKAKNVLRGYSSPKPFDISQTDRCVEYDMQVVDAWLGHLGRYLNADGEAALRGRDVLELGPGSDLGAGLYLLSKGASTYSACDVNDLAAKAPDAFYETLFARFPANSRKAVDQMREELARAKSGVSSRLNYVLRADFDLASAFEEDTVDLVFSQAAFEHFDDIDATVAGLSEVCRPGAVIVAEIDLKTHSRWIRDQDPNNIYRYPQWLYRAFRFRGAPNRVRPLEYVRALERCGWVDIAVLPLSQLDDQDASALDAAFRDSANQMTYLSVVLYARKSAAVSQADPPLSQHEPPRLSWRLQPLRGWSHDQTDEVPQRSPGACRASRVRTRARVRLPVGGDQLDLRQARHDGRDPAQVGARRRDRPGSAAGTHKHGARAPQGA